MSFFVDATRTSVAAALGMLLLFGCSKPAPTRGSSNEPSTSQFDSPAASTSSASVERRRAELLTRIRAADPKQATIVRALLNENNELGLVLSRTTNLDEVPKLLRTMLAELDKTFPGQNHTAVAYAPTDPPQPIGTARLNARSRDMTYTPASAR